MGEKTVSALDAEIAVAGSLLIEPECYFQIADTLTSDSFQFSVCKAIFQAVAELSAAGEPVDPISIKEHSAAKGITLDGKLLMEYMDVTPTAANVSMYAEIVESHAKRRALREIATGVLENKIAGFDSLIADTFAKVDGLMRSAVNGRCMSSTEAALQFTKTLDKRCTGEKSIVPSGYKNLDAILGGGFLNSGLYILAARPGMGKTTVALNIADQIKGNVLFVSLEMSTEQIMAKRTARIAKIPAYRLLMGEDFSDDEWKRIMKAGQVLSGSGVYINKRMGVTVSEIGLMARSVKNLTAVMVDYLGLIQAETRGSRYEQITEISGSLKRLAIALNVPVIALSQLSRANEQRQDKRPTLSDLRDSGAIEQDADAVLLLYRPDYYESSEEDDHGSSLIECDVAKNRHAGTGKTYFNAYLKTCIVSGANR